MRLLLIWSFVVLVSVLCASVLVIYFIYICFLQLRYVWPLATVVFPTQIIRKYEELELVQQTCFKASQVLGRRFISCCHFMIKSYYLSLVEVPTDVFISPILNPLLNQVETNKQHCIWTFNGNTIGLFTSLYWREMKEVITVSQ